MPQCISHMSISHAIITCNLVIYLECNPDAPRKVELMGLLVPFEINSDLSGTLPSAVIAPDVGPSA